MDVTIKQAAELLKVTEKTIHRWIRQGVIPFYKENNEYSFRMEELQAWARYKHLGEFSEEITDETETEEPARETDLLTALERGRIHFGIKGSSLEEVYRNIVDTLPEHSSLADPVKNALYASLIEREKLASTGIGGGIAIPHPRHPRDWGTRQPNMGIFFLEKPLPMDTPDGNPVFVMILLLTSTVKGHLQLLSQVSHLLHQAEAQNLLKKAQDPDELLSAIKSLIQKGKNA